MILGQWHEPTVTSVMGGRIELLRGVDVDRFRYPTEGPLNRCDQDHGHAVKGRFVDPGMVCLEFSRHSCRYASTSVALTAQETQIAFRVAQVFPTARSPPRCSSATERSIFTS